MDDLQPLARQLPLAGAELLRRADAVLRHVDPAVVRSVAADQRRIDYGVGPRRDVERYAYLDVYDTRLVLGFPHGVELDDPASLMRRAGGPLRTLDVPTRDVLDDRRVRALLVAARDERLAALGR